MKQDITPTIRVLRDKMLVASINHRVKYGGSHAPLESIVITRQEWDAITRLLNFYATAADLVSLE